MPGPNWARRGIVGRGVLLDAEMWYLDALAADCEDDGVYEFLLTPERASNQVMQGRWLRMDLAASDEKFRDCL